MPCVAPATGVTGRARQAGVRIDDILCEVNDINVYQNRSAIDVVKEARWPRKLVFLRSSKNNTAGKRGRTNMLTLFQCRNYHERIYHSFVQLLILSTSA